VEALEGNFAGLLWRGMCENVGAEWCPREVAVGSGGELVVRAETELQWPTVLNGLWRFSPGENVVFLEDAPTILTPGGLVGLYWWETPPAGVHLISGGNAAYFQDMVKRSDDPWITRGVLWRAAPQTNPTMWILPDCYPADPCCYSNGAWTVWQLATDCHGEVFGFTLPTTWDPAAPPPAIIYKFPEASIVASVPMPPRTLPYALAWDRFGNLYLSLFEYYPYPLLGGVVKIRRVMPEEMVSSCPVGRPLAAGAFAASAWCECVEEKLFLKATVWPEDPESQVLWSREGETLELPLGTAPKLEVLVCEDANRNCRDVEAVRRWELFAPWVQPVAEQAVFPQRPAFFYGADLDTVSESRSALLQTVHLGEQALAVKVQVNESGGSREVSRQFFLKVVEPSRLGRTNNTYDPHIVYTAHAYGIPPQVIKAQVEQESQFNERSYRYEARTQDYERFEIQKFFTGRNRAYNALRPFAITPDPRCTSTDCGICKDVPSSPELWEFRAIEYPFFPGGISAGIATPGSAGALPSGTSTSPCGRWWRATTAGYPAPRPGTSATAGYRTWKKFASKRSLNRPMRFLASRQGRAGSDNAGGADGRAAIAPGAPWTA